MNFSDKPIVFFDGKCNLCNRSVDLLVKWDKYNKLQISSLQGETARLLLKDFKEVSLNTVVLLKDKKIYTRSSAAIRILADLRWPLTPLYLLLLIPRFMRDFLYSMVSQNRYKWFGKKETCRIPTSDEERYFLP